MNWIEVAAGLIFRDGKLLIAQRFEGSHLGGLWEFPGGKREPSETWEECLRRELKEELAIEVQVGTVVETVEHVYPEKAVLLRFFLCSIVQGEPIPLGCHAVAWVDRTTLRNYRFPAADARLLAQLEASSWWGSA